jgi:calcium release-activated calcium channel protein 1
MHFRVEERDWWHLEHLWRQENRKWRREDVEQRVLENARWVWLRYAEKNRRDVEEKSEQLKSISNLSALIAGFAVVAFVELQFSDPAENPTHVHELLIVAYALTTALVVALMLNSMVLCSFMLCSILRNGKTYVSEEEEAEYLYRCRQFALEFKPGDVPPAPKRSFERHWETRCEDDWKHAFRMFTGGVPVFLANVACISWLKFHYSPPAAGAVTAVAVLAALGWAHTQNNWGWHVARGARKQREGSHAFGGAGGPPRSGAGLPFDWHARPSARGGSEFPRRDEEPTDADEEPTTTPGIHARRDAEDRAGSSMADDTTSRSSSASEGSGNGSVGVGAADVRARVDDLAERGAACLDHPSDGDGGVAGEGGPRLRVATKPSGRSGEGGEGRRVASWADLGDAARTSEERAFVRRTSPRARDIAAARAAAAATTPASTPAVEDPFEGAAAALGNDAAGARGED